MTKTTSDSNAIAFYRDSRRPQGWGGFFLAIWIAIYIGGAVPIWIIAVGALLTMTLVAAIVIKFRPKQLAAEWDGEVLTEQRFILPPRQHKLTEPPAVKRYEDDLALVEFHDGRHGHEVAVIYDDELEQQLSGSSLSVEDQRP